jgi:pimeloyl-ACP methyl ester carboxylesterase
MTRQRLFVLILSLALVALSWLGLSRATANLTVQSFDRKGVPILFISPRTEQKVPSVLIAHGFAGSRQLMLGYAHTFAQSGYAVLLWDFQGHAANPAPLSRDDLQSDLQVAYAALLEQPQVDRNRVALLGHSMGSGVVMTAGINNPDRYAATIAVSPTQAAVTADQPRNLQLQAGVWEGRFVANAQTLLQAAGGENPALAKGQGRSLTLIPNTEHITILFSPVSHQAALDWLNQTFQRPASAEDFVDRRMIWYGLHLAAWLGVLSAIAPQLRQLTTLSHLHKRPLRSWVGLLIGPLTAALLIGIASRGTDLSSVGGVMIGGALGFWFLLAGLAWLGTLARFPYPSAQ